MPVVDASIYVALFKSDEPGHEASRAWLAEAGETEEPIVSPVILLAEVASALGRGLGDEDLARQAVSLLRMRRLVELYSVALGITNASGEAESLPLALNLQEAQGADFYTVTPCRLLDTRSGEPLQSGVARLVSVDGACGVPANARALAVNLTAITPTAEGLLVLFPGNYPIPPTSTNNFRAGVTKANNVVMALSSDGTGRLALLAAVPGGTVHAAIDVFGYFAAAP